MTLGITTDYCNLAKGVLRAISLSVWQMLKATDNDLQAKLKKKEQGNRKFQAAIVHKQ